MHLLQLESELLNCLVIPLISALRPHLFDVLELSQFLASRAYFGSECFGELFLLVVELVLVWTLKVRNVRPVTPITALPFVVVVHRCTY